MEVIKHSAALKEANCYQNAKYNWKQNGNSNWWSGSFCQGLLPLFQIFLLANPPYIHYPYTICKVNLYSPYLTNSVFLFAFLDSTSSVRSQVWRSWMTQRSWRRRDPRLEKPTSCSRAATAAGGGRRTQSGNTHTLRKSQILSLDNRIDFNLKSPLYCYTMNSSTVAACSHLIWCLHFISNLNKKCI